MNTLHIVKADDAQHKPRLVAVPVQLTETWAEVQLYEPTNRADPVGAVVLKWDGCSHLDYPYKHTCDASDLLDFHNMIKTIYAYLAGVLLDFEEQSLAEVLQEYVALAEGSGYEVKTEDT